jgi:hypothetical protein
MNSPEARSRHTRSIPYGEFGGPFFDPEMLEKISHKGNKPIDLIGFMSAYGLHVIAGKKDSVFELLCGEKYGLKEVLKRTPQGNITFTSKTIVQVAKALEFSSVEQQMIEAIVGGIDSVNQIGQWLSESVRSGS